MNTKNNLKIFNDPIYGFITVPNSFIFDLIESPYFQRLRRISQMGLSYLVYPGAHHTRFHHALGSLHLMQNAVRILKLKDIKISNDEENALYSAILLHDIGHGPFSHAIENSLIVDVNHEDISIRFMEKINISFNGKLSLAIKMFKGLYDRPFFNQLISSHLDIDRCDYLKRDSFYTGVSEGNINSQRLISMMNVVNNKLVVEEKGIYSIEKFLTARRLMYWQVYLHKTGLVSEQIIIRILKRAKILSIENDNFTSGSVALDFFLKQRIDITNFTNDILEKFSLLDDTDLLIALKTWSCHSDFVLKNLSERILNRKLLKIKFVNESEIESQLKRIRKDWNKFSKVDISLMEYFVFYGKVSNIGYEELNNPIEILNKNGSISTINQSNNIINIQALSKKITRHYICFPKEFL